MGGFSSLLLIRATTALEPRSVLTDMSPLSDAWMYCPRTLPTQRVAE